MESLAVQQHHFGIVFDLDGVIHRGAKPIEGAKEVIETLRKLNIPHIFLTNSGGCTEEFKSAKLKSIVGTPFPTDRLIMATTPFKELLNDYQNKHILAISESHEVSTSIMDSYGFKNYETIQTFVQSFGYMLYPANKQAYKPTEASSHKPFEAIFILHTPHNWGEALQVICDVIRTQGDVFRCFQPDFQINSSDKDSGQTVQLFFANPDVYYADVYPIPRFTNGAFRLCLETLYKEMTGKDLKYVMYGKPFASTYQFAERLMKELNPQSSLKNVYAIGDNPLSDIKGANSYGWISILTKTGVFTGEDNDDVNPAQHVCNSVVEAIDFIFGREGISKV